MKTLYKVASLYQKDIKQNDLIQFANENKISLTCGELGYFIKLAKINKFAEILTKKLQAEQNLHLAKTIDRLMESLAEKYPYLANHPKLRMLAIAVVANLHRSKPMAEVVAKWEKENPTDVIEFSSILKTIPSHKKKDDDDILEFKSLAHE